MKSKAIAECVSFTMSSLTPSGQNMNAVCFSSQQDELKGSTLPELPSVRYKTIRVIAGADLNPNELPHFHSTLQHWTDLPQKWDWPSAGRVKKTEDFTKYVYVL